MHLEGHGNNLDWGGFTEEMAAEFVRALKRSEPAKIPASSEKSSRLGSSSSSFVKGT
jgi:hypothetical protein